MLFLILAGGGGLNREGGGAFVAYHPIPPVMDCFPVSVGRVGFPFTVEYYWIYSLPIYLVIFVNEKSLILQSWLKKLVPTFGKFMEYNN